MADFDAFESAPAAEVDPAADFLAREQNELAGLEDDNFGTLDSQAEPSQSECDTSVHFQKRRHISGINK